jgi:hypothetical protein
MDANPFLSTRSDVEAGASAPRPSGGALSWEPLLASTPSGDGAPGDGLTVEDEAVASKIREILFGQHMADYERRFTQLEVRLTREVKQLRKDATALLDGLARQLEAERKERTKDVSEISEHLRTTRQEVEVAIAKASRDAEASVVHLRHALQEETARQRRALEERTEELERHLDSVAKGLRRDKVDRASLQVLFEQLSVHFGAEPSTAPVI